MVIDSLAYYEKCNVLSEISWFIVIVTSYTLVKIYTIRLYKFIKVYVVPYVIRFYEYIKSYVKSYIVPNIIRFYEYIQSYVIRFYEYVKSIIQPQFKKMIQAHVDYLTKKFLGMLDTCNHKRIGIYYFVTGILLGIIGAMLSIIIRVELYTATPCIIAFENVNYYNYNIMNHGLMMIFFILMPILLGAFGNYFIVLMVGLMDIYYPRINNIGYLLVVLAFVCAEIGVLGEYVVGIGWTMYPPLSILTSTYLISTIFIALLISGVSSILTSVNFVMLSLYNLSLDLLLVSYVVASLMIMYSLPILSGIFLITISDILMGTSFLINYGDPIVYEHLFWFYSPIEPVVVERQHMSTAICLNFTLTFVIYHYISLTFHGILEVLVKIISKVKNEQVTKSTIKTKNSSLVGTSETLRSVPLNISDDIFDQWLAGFIDGRGNFYVKKSGNVGFELVVDKYDELVLLKIQNKLGGSIKSRVRSSSYRLALRNDNTIIHLINRINGNIRSSQRIPQFKQICNHFNITYIEPIILNNTNAWYSGYFDALGTINCNRTNMELTVSTKHEIDIKLFNTGPFSGGTYSYIKSGYGFYMWSTNDKSTIMDIYSYFKLCPSRTTMLNRILLIAEFYTLQSNQSLYSIETFNNLWDTFITKWDTRVMIKSTHINFDTLTGSDLENFQNDKDFNEWLAGFIDGDGYIRVSNGHCFLEIPQETKNISVLQTIQSKLGGTITKRTTSQNTYRYYLGTKAGMIQLTHRINGNIRGYSRQIQFKELCIFLNIPYIEPSPLTVNNAWFSGFFDSDGTITATFNKSNSIRLKATSKYYIDVELFVPVFGGKVYKQPTSYDWIVNTESNILPVYNYFTKYNLQSVKNHRVSLIPLFYQYKKSYSPNHLNWKSLETNWNMYKTS